VSPFRFHTRVKSSLQHSTDLYYTLCNSFPHPCQSNPKSIKMIG